MSKQLVVASTSNPIHRILQDAKFAFKSNSQVLTLIDFESSHIETILYCPEKEILLVSFDEQVSGATLWMYNQITDLEIQQLMDAASVGSWFHSIKSKCCGCIKVEAEFDPLASLKLQE